jgi:hypothetical protein
VWLQPSDGFTPKIARDPEKAQIIDAMLIQSFFIHIADSVTEQEVSITMTATCRSVLDNLQAILGNPESFAIYEAEIIQQKTDPMRT